MLTVGLGCRLWHINFGLPHSWYADEPELGEPAIKYTYELKTILTHNDIYKLVPESYVYGTAPVYFYTILTMAFSKTLGILGIPFTKMDLYVFMRVVNAGISFGLIPAMYLLVKSAGLTRRLVPTIAGILLVAFNWKLIVHAHYLNHDLVITLLSVVANLFFYRYLIRRQADAQAETDTANTVLFALFFGLAIATKITVLLTLPVYLVILLLNKDYRNCVAAVLIMLGVFIVTNPFAWLFMGDFLTRLLEMQTKEAGMVFDSVNYSPLKYVQALAWLVTPPVLALATAGIGLATRLKSETGARRQLYILLAVQIGIYLLFFSLQSRRVDRWLLPIVPNVLLFAVVALDKGAEYLAKAAGNRVAVKGLTVLGLAGAAVYYLYFGAAATRQFTRDTPKSAAYLWAKANLPAAAPKFGLTEEGLDPLNKLPTATIWQYNAYASKGAQFVYPPDPTLYSYVILSSRPIAWPQTPEVVATYPRYAQAWREFTAALADPAKFTLLQTFAGSEPNLIPLSNVAIYRKVI
jgi:hypothetical protein